MLSQKTAKLATIDHKVALFSRQPAQRWDYSSAAEQAAHNHPADGFWLKPLL